VKGEFIHGFLSPIARGFACVVEPCNTSYSKFSTILYGLALFTLISGL